MLSHSDTNALPSIVTGSRLAKLVARGWLTNRWLTLSGLVYVGLVPIFVVAIWADPRVITGAPAWIKPLKFALSSAIYVATFLWLLTYVQGRRRAVAIVAGLTGLGLLVENLLIGFQTLRGTTSHFNMSTPLDGAIFGIMGAFITLIAVLNLLLGIWLIFTRIPDRVVAWGVRLGVLISFVGMMTGFLMTSIPTPAQQAEMAAGRAPTSFGAHGVGVEDGGPGLPFVGWSTEGGDLRVAHFVGLHAMQVLPLLALALTRTRARQRLSAGQRTAWVIIGGVAYLGWVGVLTVQALRGQSIVAPDALTWASFALLAGGTAVALLVTGRQATMRDAAQAAH